MKLLIVKSDSSIINDNVEGIGKAWNYCGYDVAFWGPLDFSAFDVFYRFKPDIILMDSSTKNRALSKCLLEYSPRIEFSDKLPIYGDIMKYNKRTSLIVAEELKSKKSSIVAYSDEEFNLLNLKEDMKIFSNFQRRISQYCGPLNNEVRPLIISSCEEFIPTNKLDEINSLLMEKKVKLTYKPNIENLKNNFTSFHGCRKIWKKANIDKIEDFI